MYREYKDKKVVMHSYLYNGGSNTGKIYSYRNGMEFEEAPVQGWSVWCNNRKPNSHVKHELVVSRPKALIYH